MGPAEGLSRLPDIDSRLRQPLNQIARVAKRQKCGAFTGRTPAWETERGNINKDQAKTCTPGGQRRREYENMDPMTERSRLAELGRISSRSPCRYVWVVLQFRSWARSSRKLKLQVNRWEWVLSTHRTSSATGYLHFALNARFTNCRLAPKHHSKAQAFPNPLHFQHFSRFAEMANQAHLRRRS